MYNVFIVDDEVIVREGIRSKIDWNNTPFAFAGEAADGEIALSMIQDIRPDILITDIRMPFMDGLELSRMAKKMHPWIKVIIISGHDEFEYAKKAISIGVQDYILKPFTAEDLLSALYKIANDLDEQKKQYSDISKLKLKLESNTALMQKSFLTDLVTGTLNGSDTMQKAEELNINLIAHYYCICISEIHCKDGESNSLNIAKSNLLSFLSEEQDVIVFFILPEKLICIKKSGSKENLDDEIYRLANSIQYEIQKIEDCTVITSIGSIVDRTAYICDSYREAEKILKLCHFENKNKIVGSDDIKKSEDRQFSLLDRDPLVDRLKYASSAEINIITDEYVDLLGEDPSHFSIIASYLMIDVIMAVSKLIEELGGNIRDMMPEILTHDFVDNAVLTQEKFISETKRILKTILEYRDSKIQGRYGDVILRAKKYIDENFANQDICLHSVAEAVNFSPNHFSAIFSQECGITFIDYLTNTRIEAAKKLLRTTQMRSADIAYEVGFNDPHYFSFIFKKNSGLTPREYKSSETISG